MTGGAGLILLLFLAVAFIIFSTARLKVHPFLVLLVTAYALGLMAGLPATETIAAITGGFGSTLGYIGIVIAAGTIIGVILERSGAALVMAQTVVRLIGKARAALAMAFTGAVVSVPVFCDSGYIILSPLARSLAETNRQSMATFAVALSMGLYATHVFVPPTPGPIAAAGELGADIGTVILLGLLVTIPVVLVSFVFATFMGRRIYIDPSAVAIAEASTESRQTAGAGDTAAAPSAGLAFAPILIPVLLITLRSVAEYPTRPLGEAAVYTLLSFLGNPNTALLIGVCVAFLVVRGHGSAVYGEWVGAGLKNAGTIILITGAGGALGSVLQATPIAGFLSDTLADLNLGVFVMLLPFLIAASLKTAIGSSTVAIITTAPILAPMVPALGLDTTAGLALSTLAIGAGAMTVSHANDSYFWVVSQFSGMSVSEAYQLQTVGSGVAGVTGIVVVFVLSLFLL